MSFTSASTAAVAAPPARWRDVYVAATARAISNCGDILAATALALVLQGRGAGGLAVSGILLAAAVPPIVLGPLVGRLVDRVDSRTVIVATGSVQVLICVLLAYATQPFMIIGLVALLATGFAITQPAIGALIPLMVGRDNVAKASGISQTASTIGMLVGPALGGVLVGQFGSHVPLLIDAATYLAIPVAGFVIRTRRGERAARAADAARGATGAPVAYKLRGDALLWPLIVLFGAAIAALSAINVIEVFFVRETLHSSATMYGVLGAVWMAGMVLGSIIWGRRAGRDDDEHL
jgi:MFS family permease